MTRMPSNNSWLRLVVVRFAILLVAVESVRGDKKCMRTQFAVKYADGSIRCQDCPICPQGEGLSQHCGGNILAKDVRNVQCLDCIPGKTYSSVNDTSQCYACSATCSKGQVILKNCSVTSDKKCDKKCDTKGLYYEDSTGDCQPCSWCCGDQFDMEKEECKERGMPMGQICSVHRNKHCQPTATTLKHTTHQKTTGPPTPQLSTVTEATLMLNMTNTTSTTSNNNNNNNNNNNKVGKSASKKHSRTAIIIVVVFVAVMFMCACFIVVHVGRCPNSRSIHRRDPHSHAEQGMDLVDCEATAFLKDHERDATTRHKFASHAAKSESLKNLIPMKYLADGHIITECINAGKAIDEEMTLTEFANKNYIAFEKVCHSLDMHVKGCGHYEHVAKYYGVSDLLIKSGFEKHEGGASKAFFEWLGCLKPKHTVGEFVPVLISYKRNDVVQYFNV